MCKAVADVNLQNHNGRDQLLYLKEDGFGKFGTFVCKWQWIFLFVSVCTVRTQWKIFLACCPKSIAGFRYHTIATEKPRYFWVDS